MGTTAKQTVFDELVAVTYDYLGPAAKRFIVREIEAHLHKKPEQLTKDDVRKLHDWCTVAIGLLTEDNQMVDEYSRSLLAIADKRQK